MSTELTFITCFYKIYNRDVQQEYFDNFLKLVNEGYPIVLFLDNELKNSWGKELLQYTNLTIIYDFPFQEFPLVSQYPKETTILPQSRNLEKDTYEYIILMNTKLDFIVKSLSKIETEYVAWIDFSIIKIFKNQSKIKRLKYIQIPENKILIPGCWEIEKPFNKNDIDCIKNDDCPNWRFCGGLIFGKPLTFLNFYEQTSAYFNKQSHIKKLTWDVNVWAHIEEETPELFEWYQADHNDEILDFPIQPRERKIILTLMIKNEEKIITRCIEKALSTNIIDAICISDTGSTDSTISILKECSKSLTVPIKIVQHEWKNFGVNRTLSFIETQKFCEELGWNSEFTYGLLLDADMNFVVKPEFTKNDLNAEGYRIIQKTGSIEYYNTRFVKLSHPWKCVGVTHEYWSGQEPKNLETAYIEDVGDGGCKSDKFERDIRLLEQGLKDEPKNERYMFYLAQSYKDVKRLDDAIKMYKKRIDAGGWYEEVWYSMYQLSRLYYEQKDYINMEFWGQTAYSFYPKRSENLHVLTVAFRDISQHYKAWHYMNLGKSVKRGSDMLFIEYDVYDHLFDAEKTILNYYIQNHKKEENLKELIEYYNKHRTNVYHNLQHYVFPIRIIEERKLSYNRLDDYNDYTPSSTSILPDKEGYLLNIRYVNYRIQKDGSYVMFREGNGSRDNNVITRNCSLYVDSDFVTIGEMKEMKPTFQPLRDTHIKGLEDVRLYRDGDIIKFTGTSMDHSYNGSIRQITGVYNPESGEMTNGISLHPPTETNCEKNWIPLGNNRFIYSWHPMQIGELSDANLLIKETYKTPRFFEHMRGSTNIVTYNNFKYCITHCVQYVTPRKYYHFIVKLDKDTLEPKAYSLPFYFKNNDIEYTLGLAVNEKGIFSSIVSQRDSNPILLRFKIDDLVMLSV